MEVAQRLRVFMPQPVPRKVRWVRRMASDIDISLKQYRFPGHQTDCDDDSLWRDLVRRCTSDQAAAESPWHWQRGGERLIAWHFFGPDVLFPSDRQVCSISDAEDVRQSPRCVHFFNVRHYFVVLCLILLVWLWSNWKIKGGKPRCVDGLFLEENCESWGRLSMRYGDRGIYERHRAAQSEAYRLSRTPRMKVLGWYSFRPSKRSIPVSW